MTGKIINRSKIMNRNNDTEGMPFDDDYEG